MSHLHHDHCHLPSLARYGPDVPHPCPGGAERLLADSASTGSCAVVPGDVVERAGVRVEVLPATHDGRRHPLARERPPALGFRFGNDADRADVAGDTDSATTWPTSTRWTSRWSRSAGGPTLAEGHLDADAAAQAVTLVGARWAVPVHWGTFWPAGLQHVARCNDAAVHDTGAAVREALAGTEVEPVAAARGAGRRAANRYVV